MAWVRTATSLISFGFSVYKFFEALGDRQMQAGAERLLGPRGVGLVMIGLGVGSLALALIEYRRQMHQLTATFPHYGPFGRSLAAGVAVVISGLGILGFVMVFLRI